MDAEEKSVDEKIGQWLGTKFGAAHADLPDMDEWLGQAADYVMSTSRDPGGGNGPNSNGRSTRTISQCMR